MIDTTKQTGTKGLMKVSDHTDGDTKNVDLYLSSVDPIAIPSLPWSYSIDGVVSETKSFNFKATTNSQHIAKVYVGSASKFVFHLDATGHPELGGPTNLSIDLVQAQGSSATSVLVKVDGVYVRAVPYVYVGGVWKQALPMVVVNSNWTAVS